MSESIYHEPWKPISVIITGDNISVTFDGHAPYGIRRSIINEEMSKRFDELAMRVQLAYENGTEEEWEAIKAIFVPAKNMTELMAYGDLDSGVSDIKVDEKGNFYYKQYRLKNYLVERIKDMQQKAAAFGVDNQRAIRPMARFLDNLMQNPNSHSVEQLYRFVEHTHMPLSEDGCLLAYKIVTHDFKDKYTKKLDNSPGKTVWMPRNLVTFDPNITCSTGLHFCSWNYARGFFCNPKVDKMVVIKLNPKDVVSIPTDYRNEKGRCCEYTVMYEVPMEEVMETDLLGMIA